MKISWFLNDKQISTIENGVHVVMTSQRISQLTIESVTAYHRGNYHCLAENKAGSAQYIAELRVNGTFCSNPDETSIFGFFFPYFFNRVFFFSYDFGFPNDSWTRMWSMHP